ncbi:hypothetical protein RHGRI_014356 [Rhododendron griersonianum]|uniref:Uncharacterized protein n=1 Tax=Rhododendron griersonianum TaxID=479676 RepID=A0AAV6K907_9ERIC|nr:hypothetical protein RHGRI_014356 [Rhododendron griersonianum]
MSSASGNRGTNEARKGFVDSWVWLRETEAQMRHGRVPSIRGFGFGKSRHDRGTKGFRRFAMDSYNFDFTLGGELEDDVVDVEEVELGGNSNPLVSRNANVIDVQDDTVVEVGQNRLKRKIHHKRLNLKKSLEKDIDLLPGITSTILKRVGKPNGLSV